MGRNIVKMNSKQVDVLQRLTVEKYRIRAARLIVEGDKASLEISANDPDGTKVTVIIWPSGDFVIS